ncbi:hypothetical protein SRHO_G00210320 [Serrasalmus rhombeus]
MRGKHPKRSQQQRKWRSIQRGVISRAIRRCTAPGTMWHPFVPPFGYIKCAVCTCKGSTGEVHCEKVTCPPLTCSRPVRRNPSDCCKECPAEDTPLPEEGELMQADGTRHCNASHAGVIMGSPNVRGNNVHYQLQQHYTQGGEVLPRMCRRLHQRGRDEDGGEEEKLETLICFSPHASLPTSTHPPPLSTFTSGLSLACGLFWKRQKFETEKECAAERQAEGCH